MKSLERFHKTSHVMMVMDYVHSIHIDTAIKFQKHRYNMRICDLLDY